MREMISAEGLEFLVDRARTTSLATVRAEGRPHVAPIWFDLDGETLLFITGEGTVKGRKMVRDPGRACVSTRMTHLSTSC